MENEKTAEQFSSIDVNSTDFYNKLQDQLEADLSRVKKNLEIMRNLRISAVELEVETAAFYHAQLLHDIEKLDAVNRAFRNDVATYVNETDKLIEDVSAILK